MSHHRRGSNVGRVHIALFAILWSAAVVCNAHSSLYGYSAHDRLVDALRSRRNHHSQCVSAAGTCFTSGQCCSGFVCASFDDYFGLKPEVPGYCVREKDLRPCEDSSDCDGGTRCLALGRSSELYCLPARNVRPAQTPPRVSNAVVAGGGLGAVCQTSADCAAYTSDRSSRLCCQDVRRGRQGIRRQCDRYNQRISVCIGAV